MAGCSLACIRAASRAMLLCICVVFPVDGMAESGHYRVREEVLSTGVRVTQQVDAVAFPRFQGKAASSSGTDAPAVGGDRLRAVRALMPIKGDTTFALALANGSAYFTFNWYNHAILVGYGWPTTEQSTAPFWGTDKKATRRSTVDPRWSQVVDLGRRMPASATHVLVTLYVVPRLGEIASSGSTPNLVLTFNEATVQGMHVVAGRSLADSVMLAVNDADWSGWRAQPVRAGTTPDHELGFTLPAAFPSRLPFVEQRTIDLHGESGTRRRDKRCLANIAYEMSNLLFPAILEMYFGRSDLCTLDPHPHQDVAAPLPLVEVANRDDVPRLPDSAVFEATALEPEALGAADPFDAFDAAMNIQFCDANQAQTAGNEPCTDADRRASAALGDLTPEQLTELLAQIERMYDADQAGPATLRTGNESLDQWLNADLVRAENALNAAQAVVHVSSAREAPRERINEKKNKRKKQKVVKTSCVENEGAHDTTGDPSWQCVVNANRMLREQGDTVALTPQIVSRDRYSARGTAPFDRLVREFRNSGRGMPHGISDAQFGTFTAAIGRDAAPAGNNLGFVFINDPVLRGGAARFPYGVEHIWSPGGGGNHNAGHRQDWEALNGLPVRGRDLLVRVIMAALTDPNARFTQTRPNNGNVVRTFEYFVFMNGNVPFAIRNIRIVLGRNGMVVTAYPLSGASAEPLQM